MRNWNPSIELCYFVKKIPEIAENCWKTSFSRYLGRFLDILSSAFDIMGNITWNFLYHYAVLEVWCIKNKQTNWKRSEKRQIREKSSVGAILNFAKLRNFYYPLIKLPSNNVIFNILIQYNIQIIISLAGKIEWSI